MAQPTLASIWTDQPVRSLAVSDLLPEPRNARTHSKAQIAKLARSITEFGFVNPVLIDANKRIIAGHGRVAAAKQLGLSTVPTLAISHLSDIQIRAYRIADNRLAELAGWDEALLALEFAELETLETIDLDVTGFDLPDIDLMIQGLDREADPEDTLAPEPDIATVVSRRGDVWRLGDHRLICGDALQEDTYHRLLDEEKARMVFTDPPYNVRIDGHVSGLGRVTHAEFAMASGEMTQAQFTEFLTTATHLLSRFSVDGALHYICMDWRHVGELQAAGAAAYQDLKNICVWDKGQGGMGSLYRSQHELVFVFKAGSAPHINNVALGKHGRNRTNVWKYPGVNQPTAGRGRKLALHPTVKPVALVADAIQDASHRGDVVLDAFGGSGTTILAAERTGRQARVVELEPKYVDVAIARWQRMTGALAVHQDTNSSSADLADQRHEAGRATARTKEVSHV